MIEIGKEKVFEFCAALINGLPDEALGFVNIESLTINVLEGAELPIPHVPITESLTFALLAGLAKPDRSHFLDLCYLTQCGRENGPP